MDIISAKLVGGSGMFLGLVLAILFDVVCFAILEVIARYQIRKACREEGIEL